MSSIIATSSLALAKDALASIVAQSVAFQSRVGASAGDTATAAKSIYKTYLRLPGEGSFAAKRPYAIVANISEFDWTLFAGGAQNYLEPKGAMWLYLSDGDHYVDDPDNSSVEFDNFCGGVMDDLSNLAAVSDNLAITAMRLETLRHSGADKAQSEPAYWEALIRVEWQS